MKPPHRILLKTLFNNPAGDRLRTILGIEPPFYNRPWSNRNTISDLFPWRIDEEWETSFDIFDIPSLITGKNASNDEVTFVLFDQSGNEISRKKIQTQYEKMEKTLLADLLDGKTGVGTFCCFQTPTSDSISTEFRANITDRGYLSFRRKTDTVWSYVHGNQQALSINPKTGNLGFVAGNRSHDQFYRPQLPLDDCDQFELIYPNPTAKPGNLHLNLYDTTGKILEKFHKTIPSRGIYVFSIENKDRKYKIAESVSNVNMWRPIVFKYYESHFNVLHG